MIIILIHYLEIMIIKIIKLDKISSNISETPQSNISLNTGSLVTKNNPFLISNPSSNVPNVFSPTTIGNNNKNNPSSNEPLFKVGSNTNNNTFNLFNNNDNNNSIFGNNQQQKPISIFGNSGMNDGNMNVSPKLGARSIFNNNNNPSLFGSTNNTNNFNYLSSFFGNINSLMFLEPLKVQVLYLIIIIILVFSKQTVE